jgi:hypothetical protein
VLGLVRMCVAVLWALEESLIKCSSVMVLFFFLRGRVVGAGGIADKVLVCKHSRTSAPQ